MKEIYRILIADDEPLILNLYRKVLYHPEVLKESAAELEDLEAKLFGNKESHDNKASFYLKLCQQADEAVDAVRASIEENKPYTIAFLDVRMPPGPDGIQAAEQIRALDPNIEIVIVTAHSDMDPEDILRRVPPAEKILYVKKPFHPEEIRQFALSLTAKWSAERELSLTNKELERRIELRTAELAQANELLKEDLKERKLAEKAAQESEWFLSEIFTSIKDGISILDTNFNIVRTNQAMEKWYSNSMPLVGKKCHQVYRRNDTPCEICPTRETMETGKQAYRVVPKWGPDEQIVGWLDLHTFPIIKKETGKVEGIIEYARDITKRRQLEQQLLQAQKMESIGTLAGGIAHDFNNILFVVIGFTELSLEEVKQGTPLHDKLTEVLNASKRAKDLVKQILTFGRKDNQEKTPLQISYLVLESIRMLRSTIPANIEIKKHICEDDLTINANSSQMHQILVNLVTNATHAIEENGIIEIGLEAVNIDKNNEIQYSNIPPGNYAKLYVSDNGCGIEKENFDLIFDPYFTSKEPGKGTGLGLSVVHGIVKIHSGFVKVYSEVGKGTTFHVYLPLTEQKCEVSSAQQTEQLPTGTEHILLVDDEPSIVKMQKLTLEQMGYTVTTRTSSKNALKTFRSAPDSFDLLITDMSMPNMNGDQLALKTKKIRENLPVILCTGFSETTKGRLDEGLQTDGFLMKPVDRLKMAKMIRKVLDKDKS